MRDQFWMFCTALYSDYINTLSPNSDEIKSAAAVLRSAASVCPEHFDRLNELAEQCTFTVRNYGGGAFYCWPRHPEIDLSTDPWPASRFPKSVLCIVIAEHLSKQPAVVAG